MQAIFILSLSYCFLFTYKQVNSVCYIVNHYSRTHPCLFEEDLPFHILESHNLYRNLSSGDAFIYSDKKLCRLSRPQGRLHTVLILSDFELAVNHIKSIFYNRFGENLLPVGAVSKGLYMFESKYFIAATVVNGLLKNISYVVLPFGNKILSCQGYLFNLEHVRDSPPLLADHTTKYYTFAKDQNGCIWTSAVNKLSSSNPSILIRKAAGKRTAFYKDACMTFIASLLFLETGWFRVCGAILLIFAVWLLLKIRVKRLKAKNTALNIQVAQQTVALQDQIKALEQTRQQLEHQTHLHKRLSAAISHDIKSPLRFVVLSLKKIHEQLVREKHPLSEGIDRIHQASSGMYDYTLMLTDYSKFLLEGNEMPPQKIELCSLIDEKIQLLRELADQKGITIRNEVPAKVHIVTHPILLSIVFHNLLDNALKFTLEGTIQINSHHVGSRVKISIQDNGMGMSSSQLDAFNAYNSHKETDSTHHISTQGLGLKISKDLVGIMQGWMRISSAPKGGTLVTFELPIELTP